MPSPSSAHAARTLRRASIRFTALWASALLVACGGGGGDAPAPVAATPPAAPAAPSAPAAPAAPVAATLQGVVAAGAPFTGATVTVTDSRGRVVGTTSTPVGVTGTYQVTLATDAVAPFVLTAARTTADGAVETLVSVRPVGTSGTVNLTPLTTLVAARLSTSGNPATLAADVAARPSAASEAEVTARVDEVRRIIAPVMAATNTTQVDLLNGTFAADGTGQDRLLDALTVNIIPASGASANVEVGIKVQGADGAQPPVIRFTNADNLAAIEAANAAVLATQIDPATVVASGTQALIQEFLARMTTCHAVPLAERAVSGGTFGMTVTAAACRTLFLNDSPDAYLSDGLRVALGQTLTSLLTAEGTGLTFGQGTYEFTRTNGDLVIGYTSRTAGGDESMDTLVVRRVGDTLKLVGNQYVFPGHIYPFMQHRHFVANDGTGADYRSTGYVAQVVNRVNASGQPIFDRVEVVTPGGATLTLKPSPASLVLVLAQNGLLSNTSYVRLRTAFDDPTLTIRPAQIEARDIFFPATDLTDAELTAIPAQSVWTYRYYLASNPTVVATTQYYRTRARALTIPEFRTQALSTLDAATETKLRVGSASAPIGLGGLAALDVGWTVPAGAIPPRQVVMFGTAPTATGVQVFNDYADVTSIARSGSVPCTAATAADVHCTATTPVQFTAGTRATGVYLLARERNGREFATYYTTYKVTLPAR